MDKRQALEFLNIDENTLNEEILKRTYRRLSMIHHPDKQNLLNKKGESDSKFAEINEAYNFLLNLINAQSIVKSENKSGNDSALRSENEELKREIQDLRELNAEIIGNKAKEISEVQAQIQVNVDNLLERIAFERAICSVLLSIWLFFKNRNVEKMDDRLMLRIGAYFLFSVWSGYKGLAIAIFNELYIFLRDWFKKKK